MVFGYELMVIRTPFLTLRYFAVQTPRTHLIRRQLRFDLNSNCPAEKLPDP